MSENDYAETRIAPRPGKEDWKAKHWIKISRKIEGGTATEEDWKKGIKIFEDRIRGRYLDIVDTIQPQSYSGFAVMALDCLLIETLQQFYKGQAKTPSGEGKIYFREFLLDSAFFNEFFDEDEKATDIFYDHIRNGILHQAETKGDSKVWIRKGKEAIVKIEGEDDSTIALDIHRKKFHKLLEKEFEHYLSLLRNPANESERTNFKKKMDAICRISEEA